MTVVQATEDIFPLEGEQGTDDLRHRRQHLSNDKGNFLILQIMWFGRNCRLSDEEKIRVFKGTEGVFRTELTRSGRMWTQKLKHDRSANICTGLPQGCC